VRDIMDDLGDDVPSTTKSAYSAPWGNGESLFDDGFDFSSDPSLPGEDVKAGQDEEGLSRSEKGRGVGDSPEHDASTSHSEARDYAFNSSVPSGR
jgi:epidermal growth factor receptor substrate 15